ncbi:hypothetical protein BV898_07367 [Hypsibius exemplaris]|uniref:Uncharacterized protein n=1 Tax=Hypsibius exemplaris TaxID=2072580 RepID=A0A1W0WTM0_HYPEX|nr:hypothetical protein BV898_07367 [Hypsibius exemplaris]
MHHHLHGCRAPAGLRPRALLPEPLPKFAPKSYPDLHRTGLQARSQNQALFPIRSHVKGDDCGRIGTTHHNADVRSWLPQRKRRRTSSGSASCSQGGLPK